LHVSAAHRRRRIIVAEDALKSNGRCRAAPAQVHDRVVSRLTTGGDAEDPPHRGTTEAQVVEQPWTFGEESIARGAGIGREVKTYLAVRF
jgi:hypothetical protein